MISKKYDQGSQMLRYFDKPKKIIETSIESGTIEMKLPELKGLRNSVLKMIFGNLSNIELLKMGEVNKEFYQISRDDIIWKNRIEKEFPFLYSKNQKDFSACSSYGRFQYTGNKRLLGDYQTVCDDHLNILIQYGFSKSSLFCEYWYIRNRLLSIKYEMDVPQKNRKKKFFKNFYNKNIFLECGIKVKERKKFLEKGYCHGSVQEVFESLLENTLLSKILSQFDQEWVSEWKNQISQSVSLECMENPKTNTEIKSELKRTILNKIISF